MPVDAFIGEIQPFAFGWAPENYYICHGSLVSVGDNQALYSLIGDRYGGDGRTNFGLPDLRGRAPVGFLHNAINNDVFPHILGEAYGRETTQISKSELPSHNHWADLDGSKIYAATC